MKKIQKMNTVCLVSRQTCSQKNKIKTRKTKKKKIERRKKYGWQPCSKKKQKKQKYLQKKTHVPVQ